MTKEELISIIKHGESETLWWIDGGLTVDKLLSNDYVSKTRNKLIAFIFKECGIIEKYGSGIHRIFDICKDYGIQKPDFKEIGNGFLDFW